MPGRNFGRPPNRNHTWSSRDGYLLRLHMRPLTPVVLPIPANADPAKVQIKQISVTPLEVEVERIQTPQVAMPGLPPIPGDILELEGLLAGLEHTISAIGDGTHSSLREGQAKVADAQRQWEQMKAELEAHEIHLLQKQERILGEATNNSENWLAEKILANPTGSLAGIVRRWSLDARRVRFFLTFIVSAMRNLLERF